MKVFSTIISIILFLAGSFMPVTESLTQNKNLKLILKTICYQQKIRTEFYEGSEVKYAYTDIDNDNIKDMIWMTPISGGFTLYNMSLLIVLGNGEIININTYMYTSKSLDNLKSIDIMTDQNNNTVYRFQYSCFSTGEQIEGDVYYDEIFNINAEYTSIESNNQFRYYINSFNFTSSADATVTKEIFDCEKSEFEMNLTKIRSIDFSYLDNFTDADIDSFMKQLSEE